MYKAKAKDRPKKKVHRSLVSSPLQLSKTKYLVPLCVNVKRWQKGRVCTLGEFWTLRSENGLLFHCFKLYRNQLSALPQSPFRHLWPQHLWQPNVIKQEYESAWKQTNLFQFFLNQKSFKILPFVDFSCMKWLLFVYHFSKRKTKEVYNLPRSKI